MRNRFIVGLTIVVFFGGCADLLDPAAAVVYGDKITVGEVNVGVETFTETSEFERLSAQGDPQSIQRQFEQGFLSQLIRRAVLQPKAEELGVEVTQAEVSARLDQIQGDFPSEAAFQEALKEQGLDEGQLRVLVTDSLLEQEIRTEVTAEARPTEAELRGYYKAHVDDFRETRAQHILVDNEALAQSLVDRLEAAPKKQIDHLFRQLAREFSTDKPNAKKGGDLGYFPSSGEGFVAPFRQAVTKLGAGDISAPVKTQFGWHVIRVTDERVQAFDQVRNELEGRLATQTEDRVWGEWLKAAYEEAEVKVNPRYGELDADTGQVVDASAKDIPGAEEPSIAPSPTVPAGR